ncbi:DUF4406 domain-containing protein [Selenomonas ruminantium]|uniref:DUF7768 domain-containing protein n=1 Tax=Selenomonas ruminantium TaxID=971 RepID=UPI00047CE373|nr:DUF4406 domain-containing protein [Selenomonas ruminantium]
MCIERFNSEGYADTTAQSALAKVEAAERRNAWPVVYVCSAYRGNERVNVLRARNYCRFVVSKKRVPIAPHLLFPQFITEATERGLAMKMDCLLLRRCDEVWAFGEITEGMATEIEMADDEGKRVRYFTRDLKEVTKV